MGGVIAESLLATVLEEAVKRIAKKVASGKKLSDSEVMILLLDQMNRRIEERFRAVDSRLSDIEKSFNLRLDSLKDYVDGRLSEMSKRIEDLSKNLNARIDDLSKSLNARIDDLSKAVHALSVEVSSIKTDIIKLLKEERR